MRVGRIVGALVAVAMMIVGGFLALAGLGYLGESASRSGTWSVLGSLIAGFGIALTITLFQRRPSRRGGLGRKRRG